MLKSHAKPVERERQPVDALSSSRRASLGLPAPHTPTLSEWRAGSLCLNIAYLISLGASVHHLRTISATLFALSITDGHCGITPPPRLTRLKAYANKHAQCCHSRPRASERKYARHVRVQLTKHTRYPAVTGSKRCSQSA